MERRHTYKSCAVVALALLASCVVFGCKKEKRPDAITKEVVQDPLASVPEEVRALVTSERAMLVIKLDPIAYKSLYRPLREKLAPMMSWLPAQGAWLKEDIWEGIGSLDERMKTGAISKELPAYLIAGLGSGETFEACVEAMMPCPYEALEGVDTFTLLLPTANPEQLRADVSEFIPESMHNTRSVGARYIQVDVNERWDAPQPIIAYEKAPRRQVTSALVDALAAPGGLSVWADGRAPGYIGAAVGWSQIHHALASATPEMRATLRAIGASVISGATLVRYPALQEYHDIAFTLRGEQKRAHLDLAMSRTKLGAKVAVASDQDAKTAKVRVPNALLELETDYDLGEAMRSLPATKQPELVELLRDGGPMAYAQLMTRPVSGMREMKAHSPEFAMFANTRAVRFALDPDVDYARATPIGMPACSRSRSRSWRTPRPGSHSSTGAPSPPRSSSSASSAAMMKRSWPSREGASQQARSVKSPRSSAHASPCVCNTCLSSARRSGCGPRWSSRSSISSPSSAWSSSSRPARQRPCVGG